MTKTRRKSLVGWVFPCEFYRSITKKFGLIGINEDLPPMASRKELIGEKCICGKQCKPIKIRVTIEELPTK